ncbi:hypothetical protein C8F04DRAFT_304811 [Mycena alexandri]|uniref:Uncharacterized protein n=1 Tax=Mycena alexandri TaxID=1745969 RepID=A0AAD6T3U5_9AGAR|nr:hypothetical protein C8F04DRAFT_304811 [Mycena alexandri]
MSSFTFVCVPPSRTPQTRSLLMGLKTIIIRSRAALPEVFESIFAVVGPPSMREPPSKQRIVFYRLDKRGNQAPICHEPRTSLSPYTFAALKKYAQPSRWPSTLISMSLRRFLCPLLPLLPFGTHPASPTLRAPSAYLPTVDTIARIHGPADTVARIRTRLCWP